MYYPFMGCIMLHVACLQRKDNLRRHFRSGSISYHCVCTDIQEQKTEGRITFSQFSKPNITK